MIFKYSLRNIKTLEILRQCLIQQLIFWVSPFFILKTSIFITRSAYLPSICIRIRLPVEIYALINRTKRKHSWDFNVRVRKCKKNYPKRYPVPLHDVLIVLLVLDLVALSRLPPL